MPDTALQDSPSSKLTSTTSCSNDGIRKMNWTWQPIRMSSRLLISPSYPVTIQNTNLLRSLPDCPPKCSEGKTFTHRSSSHTCTPFLNHSFLVPPLSTTIATSYSLSVSKSAVTTRSRKAYKKTCTWRVCQTQPTTVSLQTFSSRLPTTTILNSRF